MEYMDLDEVEDKFNLPKRGILESRKTYLTKGHGYEEDYDLVLEGKKCQCGGTLHYHRRHEPVDTRISPMIGGTGKHTEIIHKRVETVVCSTCNSSHDIGIYNVYREERKRSNPLTFFFDD